MSKYVLLYFTGAPLFIHYNLSLSNWLWFWIEKQNWGMRTKQTLEKQRGWKIIGTKQSREEPPHNLAEQKWRVLQLWGTRFALLLCVANCDDLKNYTSMWFQWHVTHHSKSWYCSDTGKLVLYFTLPFDCYANVISAFSFILNITGFHSPNEKQSEDVLRE